MAAIGCEHCRRRIARRQWGGADPNNRMMWQDAGLIAAETTTRDHIRALGQARQASRALRRGDYVSLGATEDTLASSLTLTVKSGVATCTDAGFGASGTVEYAGPLGSTATAAILGNVAQGNQAGDRTLAAGTNEVLCMNVRLPLATVNTSQGQTTTATFTFAAEQTANNP